MCCFSTQLQVNGSMIMNTCAMKGRNIIGDKYYSTGSSLSPESGFKSLMTDSLYSEIDNLIYSIINTLINTIINTVSLNDALLQFQ